MGASGNAVALYAGAYPGLSMLISRANRSEQRYWVSGPQTPMRSPDVHNATAVFFSRQSDEKIVRGDAFSSGVN